MDGRRARCSSRRLPTTRLGETNHAHPLSSLTLIRGWRLRRAAALDEASCRPPAKIQKSSKPTSFLLAFLYQHVCDSLTEQPLAFRPASRIPATELMARSRLYASLSAARADNLHRTKVHIFFNDLLLRVSGIFRVQVASSFGLN